MIFSTKRPILEAYFLVSLRWRKVFDFVGFKSSFGVRKSLGGLTWLTPFTLTCFSPDFSQDKKPQEKKMLDRQLKISKFLVNLLNLAKHTVC